MSGDQQETMRPALEKIRSIANDSAVAPMRVRLEQIFAIADDALKFTTEESVMEVAKVTLNDGFSWHDVRDAGFNDRVRAAQANRQTGLRVIELQQMSEAEYRAIPATGEVWKTTQST